MKYIKVINYIELLNKTLFSIVDLYSISNDKQGIDFKQQSVKQIVHLFVEQTISENIEAGKKILIVRPCCPTNWWRVQDLANFFKSSFPVLPSFYQLFYKKYGFISFDECFFNNVVFSKISDLVKKIKINTAYYSLNLDSRYINTILTQKIGDFCEFISFKQDDLIVEANKVIREKIITHPQAKDSLEREIPPFLVQEVLTDLKNSKII